VKMRNRTIISVSTHASDRRHEMLAAACYAVNRMVSA
jgi:hypothetical protein